MSDKMEYYNCRVRLAGSTQNEVLKTCLSAPELLIVRKIHGAENVLDVELAKLPEYKHKSYDSSRDKQLQEEGLMRDPSEIDPDEDFDDESERQRLATLYGRGLGFDPAKDENIMTPIEHLFGGQYVPLPRRLPEREKELRAAARAKEKKATGKGKKKDEDMSQLEKIA